MTESSEFKIRPTHERVSNAISVTTDAINSLQFIIHLSNEISQNVSSAYTELATLPSERILNPLSTHPAQNTLVLNLTKLLRSADISAHATQVYNNHFLSLEKKIPLLKRDSACLSWPFVAAHDKIKVWETLLEMESLSEKYPVNELNQAHQSFVSILSECDAISDIWRVFTSDRDTYFKKLAEVMGDAYHISTDNIPVEKTTDTNTQDTTANADQLHIPSSTSIGGAGNSQPSPTDKSATIAENRESTLPAEPDDSISTVTAQPEESTESVDDLVHRILAGITASKKQMVKPYATENSDEIADSRENIAESTESPADARETPTDSGSTPASLEYNAIHSNERNTDKTVTDISDSAESFPESENSDAFPKLFSETLLRSFSWTVLPKTFAVKTIDKSVVEHHGSGIPTQIRFFFHADALSPGSSRTIRFTFKGKIYFGHITRENYLEKIKDPRTRIFWTPELVKDAKLSFDRFADQDGKSLVFTPTEEDDLFNVSVMQLATNLSDSELINAVSAHISSYSSDSHEDDGSKTQDEENESIKWHIVDNRIAKMRLSSSELNTFNFNIPQDIAKDFFNATTTLKISLHLYDEVYIAYVSQKKSGEYALLFPKNAPNRHLISFISTWYATVQNTRERTISFTRSAKQNTYFLAFGKLNNNTPESEQSNPIFQDKEPESIHLYRIINSLPRHTAKTVSEISCGNGLYFVFDNSEYYGTYDRIVYIGTHIVADRLPERIREMFTSSKNGHVLRKYIGAALLASRQDPYVEIWKKDTSNRTEAAQKGIIIDELKEREIEDEVTAYMEKHFSIAYVELASPLPRVKHRKDLLSFLNYLYSKDTVVSPEWIGAHFPTQTVQQGLWARVYTTLENLPDDEMEFYLNLESETPEDETIDFPGTAPKPAIDTNASSPLKEKPNPWGNQIPKKQPSFEPNGVPKPLPKKNSGKIVLDQKKLDEAKEKLKEIEATLRVDYGDDEDIVSQKTENLSDKYEKQEESRSNGVSSVSSSEWDDFCSHLSPLQKQYLIAMLENPNNTGKLDEIVRKSDKFTEEFVDELNEVACEYVGESIIEDDTISDDYQPLLSSALAKQEMI